MTAIATPQALLFRQHGSVSYVENRNALPKIFSDHPFVASGHVTIVPEPNVHRFIFMADQTKEINELKESVRSFRRQFISFYASTTIETFLGMLGFQGEKDFANAVQLPAWVEAWVPKEELQEEVALRCLEAAHNTTHCVHGHESVQTLLDAWEEEQVSEDSYKRLMLMNISIFKGYRSDEPASVGQLLDALFEDHEALAKIVAEMLADKSWVIRGAKRSSSDPGGKIRRERFLAEVNAKRAASGKGLQV
jgi:hypothetical protein